MEFGAAHLYNDPAVPSVVFALIGLGVAAALTLLVVRIAPVSDTAAGVTLGAAAIVCLVSALLLGETGRKLVALLAALVFPTLACLRRDILTGDLADRTPLSRTKSMVEAIRGLLFASAVTTLGIIAVIGLLASLNFIVKVNQFLGIKAAHAVPILVIGAAAITGLPSLSGRLPQELVRIRKRLEGFLAEPARVGQLLIALAALAAFAMIVARTGNEPGVGVSGIELKFRSLLDRVLPVRPRTKEFLIGHPALVLALALWYRGRKKIALPLYIVGVIGQVSILNTFCHTHTPLYLSFVRDVTGIVFGAIIGLAAFWIVDRMFPQAQEAAEPPRGAAAVPSPAAVLSADG